MLRSTLVSALFLILLPSTVSALFLDAVGHRYEDAITYVLNEGIVSGYPDRSFKPDQAINRAEFTKIIMGARYPALVTSCDLALPFPDVATDAWYTPYVCAAYTKEIIQGYGDGMFKPEQEVNVAEAAKIIAHAYGLVPGTAAAATWYQPSVDALKRNTAYPPSVSDVAAKLTRGEMAYSVHRLEAYADVPSASEMCKVAGCSGQLCVEEDDPGVSTCERREEYTCYTTTVCERQADGRCGWTVTPELTECLESHAPRG